MRAERHHEPDPRDRRECTERHRQQRSNEREAAEGANQACRSRSSKAAQPTAIPATRTAAPSAASRYTAAAGNPVAAIDGGVEPFPARSAQVWSPIGVLAGVVGAGVGVAVTPWTDAVGLGGRGDPRRGRGDDPC